MRKLLNYMLLLTSLVALLLLSFTVQSSYKKNEEQTIIEPMQNASLQAERKACTFFFM